MPIDTAGYVTATQAPNGIIEIVTSKTTPAPLQIELNEAWVLSDAPSATYDSAIHDVRKFTENYPSGKLKATWSGGLAGDGAFRLDGPQTFYYENGNKLLEATFAAGKKVGTETYWNADGHKKWERDHAADGTWTWHLFDGADHLLAESKWKGKDLQDVTLQSQQK